MNQDAIAQARVRLERAHAALKAMETTNDPAEIEDKWEAFLMAAGQFYSKLEQGAKRFGKSEAWFGRKKHERKTDPLLSYLHHARNAEEHGIKRITKRSNSHITLAPGAAVKLVADKKGWNVEESIGTIGYPQDVVLLVPVQDSRYRDWFATPASHLGKDLADLTPVSLATLGIAYFEQMLAEASGL